MTLEWLRYLAAFASPVSRPAFHCKGIRFANLDTCLRRYDSPVTSIYIQRHSCVGRSPFTTKPAHWLFASLTWIPAFAGMTLEWLRYLAAFASPVSRPAFHIKSIRFAHLDTYLRRYDSTVTSIYIQRHSCVGRSPLTTKPAHWLFA